MHLSFSSVFLLISFLKLLLLQLFQIAYLQGNLLMSAPSLTSVKQCGT